MKKNLLPISISETNGLALLTDEDLLVYSIGISAGGIAELKMAEMNPNRQIIASTIDSEGAKFVQNHIAQKRDCRTKLLLQLKMSQSPFLMKMNFLTLFTRDLFSII